MRRSLFLALGAAGLAWIVGVVVFGAADLVVQVIARGDGPPVVGVARRINWPNGPFAGPDLRRV